MEARIKCLHDAAVKSLHTGNSKTYDRDTRRNEAIMKQFFQNTMKGTMKGFYLVDEETFRCYHRSPKEDDTIQLSYGFYRDGHLIPCGDIQMHCFKDLIREGYPSGLYRAIA